MANLQAFHIQQARPFLQVGVDMGGPFETKTNKFRKPHILNSYLYLFVCLASKEICLEVDPV